MKLRSFKFALSTVAILSLVVMIAKDSRLSQRTPATTHRPLVEFEIVQKRDLTRAPAIGISKKK